MTFDHERLASLAMGAKEAPDGGNVVVTVADLRWLTSELASRQPSPPVPKLNEYNQPITEIIDGSGDIIADVSPNDQRGTEPD